MERQPVGLESIEDFEASLAGQAAAPGANPEPFPSLDSDVIGLADSAALGAGATRKSGEPPPHAPPAQPKSSTPGGKPRKSDSGVYERWVGKVFSHFRLMRVMGAGSMGVVFQAEDVHLKRICAIKVLRRQVKGEEKCQQVERFLLEARAAAALDHPSIAHVYEINQHSGWWYIAQEFLEGGSLHQLVQATGPLAFDRALLMLLDAARGLEAAHEAGIIHRDIKPANLMLTRRGRCKLVDFGLVKLDSSENPFQDDDKVIIGTPLYVAPEVVERQGATSASDVYSLGATTFALLTSRPPFTSDSIKKILRMQVEAPVPDIRERLPACPEAVATLLKRSMAKNPADRPTIAQFAATLQGEISVTTAFEGTPQLSDSGRFTEGLGSRSRILPGGASATMARPALRSRLWPVIAAMLVLGSLLALWSFRGALMPMLGGAAPLPTFTNSIGMTFAEVPPGTFTMGSPAAEPGRNSDERQIEVTITRPFAISVTEVTQEQWGAVMGDDYAPPEGVHPNETGGRRFVGPSLPAYVSWTEAAEFCRRLSMNEGRLYRLPTEAEWEYACRAGTKTAFAFGQRLDAARANIDGDASDTEASPGPRRPLPVASYQPNRFGLYDTHGNVMEWCADWKDEYPIGPVIDPSGPETGSTRVVRGGSWDTSARVARSANRWGMVPVVRTDSIGFRVVTEPDAPPPSDLPPYLIERPEPAHSETATTARPAERPFVDLDAALPAYEPQARIDQRIRSVGSDTMDRLMLLWERRFQSWHPEVEVRHEGRGSGTAMPALLEGISHFGPMSRPLKAEERSAYLAEHGYEPLQLTVALDTLAVFVHPSNPILRSGITLDELDAVFSTTRKRGLDRPVTTWGDLGLKGEWAKSPIRVYGRNRASGTYGVFRDIVLKGGNYKPTNTELIGSAEVVDAVANDPFAIGYSGIGYVTPSVRALPIAPTSGAPLVEPIPSAAHDGSYPLSRPLLLALDLPPGAAPSARQREFMRFVLSREGQALVIDAGFFPLDAATARRELAKLGL